VCTVAYSKNKVRKLKEYDSNIFTFQNNCSTLNTLKLSFRKLYFGNNTFGNGGKK